MATHLSAWLATYWLHTCAAALAGSLAIARLADPALRERLWRAALVLPLLTATAAVGWRAAPDADRAPLAPAELGRAWPQSSVVTGARPEPALSEAPTPAAAPRAPRWWTGLTSAVSSPAATRTLVGLWLGVGALLALGLARDLRRWRRELGARRRVTDRLSVLAGLATPVVVGRDEVCLPAQALTELGRDELAAVLAHEEAHIARRDPVWMLGVELLVRLAWAQPLVALVARRWRADVERVCDLAAAGRVGALPLVRGLERVAAWTQGTRRPALLVPAATSTRSALVARVEGVLSPAVSARRRTVAAAGIGVAALAAALGCVGVGPRAEQAEGARPREVVTASIVSGGDTDGAAAPRSRHVVGVDVARARYSLDDTHDLDEPSLRAALRALYAREPAAMIWIEPDRDIPIAAFNEVVWRTIEAGFTHIDANVDRIGTELPEPLREHVLQRVVGHLGSGVQDVRIDGSGRIDLWLQPFAILGLSASFVEMNRVWLSELVQLHDAWLTEHAGSSPGSELVWHLEDKADASSIVGVLALGHLAEVGARRVGFVTGSTGEAPLWCARAVRGAAVGRLTADADEEAVLGALSATDHVFTLQVGAGVTVGRVAALLRAAKERGVESFAVVEDVR